MTKKNDQNAARSSGGGSDHVRPPYDDDEFLRRWRLALDELVQLTPEALLARVGTANASRALTTFLNCDQPDITSNYTNELRNAELTADLYATWYGECGCTHVQGRDIEIFRPEDLNILKPLQVFEAFGTIDRFDVLMGFGTIKCDSDLPDILLHVSCLANFGYRTASPGARIHCKAMSSYGNIQAIEIMALEDDSVSLRSLAGNRPAPSAHYRQPPGTAYWELSFVKKWSRKLGIGYLARGEGMDDIFINRETILKYNFSNLRKGQTLLVCIEYRENGAVARAIRSVTGTWPR